MWHENRRNVHRSDLIELNDNLIKLPLDFKKYFPSIVVLRPHRERDYFNNILNYPLGLIF